MSHIELESGRVDRQQEDGRFAALHSTEILDTEPEAPYDAVTRLAAEYFQADTALLGFADESRVWIKSHWGEAVRELPRSSSIFDMVLARNGPVIVPDVGKHPQFAGTRMTLRRLDVLSFASVPVRSSTGNILGSLTIFGREVRRNMALDELRMLESLADMVASQLELRKLRRTFNGQGVRPPATEIIPSTTWPRRSD